MVFFCQILGHKNHFPNHDHDGDDDYDESENDISDNDLLKII